MTKIASRGGPALNKLFVNLCIPAAGTLSKRNHFFSFLIHRCMTSTMMLAMTAAGKRPRFHLFHLAVEEMSLASRQCLVIKCESRRISTRRWKPFGWNSGHPCYSEVALHPWSSLFLRIIGRRLELNGNGRALAKAHLLCCQCHSVMPRSGYWSSRSRSRQPLKPVLNETARNLTHELEQCLLQQPPSASAALVQPARAAEPVVLPSQASLGPEVVTDAERLKDGAVPSKRIRATASKEKLIRLSKRGVRAIFRVPPWTSSLPLYQQLQICRLPQRMDYKLLVFTHRCTHSLTSTLLTNEFSVLGQSNARTQSITRGQSFISLSLPTICLWYNLSSLYLLTFVELCAVFSAASRCWFL